MAKKAETRKHSTQEVKLLQAADKAVIGQSETCAALAGFYLGGKKGTEAAQAAVKALGFAVKDVALQNAPIIRRATSEHIAILANGGKVVHDRDQRLEAAQKARKSLGLARKSGKRSRTKASGFAEAFKAAMQKQGERAKLVKWAAEVGYVLSYKPLKKDSKPVDPKLVSRRPSATPLGAPASNPMPAGAVRALVEAQHGPKQ